MTSAWGDAWGESLGGGVIVNDGIAVEVGAMVVEIELDVTVFEADVADAPVAVEFSDESIVLEVEEW